MFSKRIALWVTRTAIVSLLKLTTLTLLCIFCFYVMAVQHKRTMLEQQARSANVLVYSENTMSTGSNEKSITHETQSKAETMEANIAAGSVTKDERPIVEDIHDEMEDEIEEEIPMEPKDEASQKPSNSQTLGVPRDDATNKHPDSVISETTSQKLSGPMSPKKTSNVSHSSPKLKTILLWNHFFLKKDFGLELGTGLFEGVHCNSTCNITTDRRVEKTADAVVIHTFHLMKDLKDATIPVRASQRQIFVFLLLENPQRSLPGLVNLPYNDLFNLTFSYLDDPETDLYTPYGEIRRRPEPMEEAVPTLEAVSQKNKSVAWLISNCHAPSSRYEYVDILSQHINVDILGKCGLDACPRGLDCMDFLDKQYLFYLAFENGFCKDYVTEKTFRTLRHSNMVPIVLGGANYSKIFPAKSYIDVREYKSPKHLADYLKHLSANRTEYLEYFRWKRDYHVLTLKKMKFLNFCKLCGILYDENYKYKKNFKPLKYWDPELCLTGDDEREAVHIF